MRQRRSEGFKEYKAGAKRPGLTIPAREFTNGNQTEFWNGITKPRLHVIQPMSVGRREGNLTLYRHPSSRS